MAIDPKSFYKEGTSLLDAQGAVQALLSGRKKEERRGKKVLAATLFHNILEQANYTNAIDDVGEFEENMTAEEDFLTTLFNERETYIADGYRRGGGDWETTKGKDGKDIVTWSNPEAIKTSFLEEEYARARNIRDGQGVYGTVSYSEDYRDYMNNNAKINYENWDKRQGKYDFTNRSLSETTKPLQAARREGRKEIMHASNINPIRKVFKTVFGGGVDTGAEQLDRTVEFVNRYRDRDIEYKSVKEWNEGSKVIDKEGKSRLITRYTPLEPTPEQLRAVEDGLINGKYKVATDKAGEELNEKETAIQWKDEFKNMSKALGPGAHPNAIFIQTISKYLNTSEDMLSHQSMAKIESNQKIIKDELADPNSKLNKMFEFVSDDDRDNYVAIERYKSVLKVIGRSPTAEEAAAIGIAEWGRRNSRVNDWIHVGEVLQGQIDEENDKATPNQTLITNLKGEIKTLKDKTTLEQKQMRADYKALYSLDPYYTWHPTYEIQKAKFTNLETMQNAKFQQYVTRYDGILAELNKIRTESGEDPVKLTFDRNTVAALESFNLLSLYIKNIEIQEGRTFTFGIISDWLENENLYELGMYMGERGFEGPAGKMPSPSTGKAVE